METKQITPEEVIKELKGKPWKWYNWTYWYLRYRIWRIPGDLRRDTVAFFQRGRRGWADRDTWDFFGYLSTIIKEGLIHLKKYQHGYPGDLKEEEWNKILDDIIAGFSLAEEFADGERMGYMPKLSEEDRKEFKAFSKEEDEKMKKGMYLFIKHYFSLWD